MRVIIVYCSVLFSKIKWQNIVLNFLQCLILSCLLLSCVVLYCVVLYYIVLYCIVLCCIVLYLIVLYCIVLYLIVLYCVVLYCIVSYFYCTVFNCTVLHHIVISTSRSLLSQWPPHSVILNQITLNRLTSYHTLVRVTCRRGERKEATQQNWTHSCPSSNELRSPKQLIAANTPIKKPIIKTIKKLTSEMMIIVKDIRESTSQWFKSRNWRVVRCRCCVR